MPASWITIVGFCALLACGSPAPPTKPTPPQEPTPAASVEAPVEDTTEAPAPPIRPAPTPPPIAIPNGRLYDGYVVGGLPNTAQFDQAVEAGFDSAMSLMANDEEGIGEIARYASSIGVRYMRFTIKDESELTEATAWEFASTLAMLGRPAIIHSANGERVGAIFALMAFFVDEATEEEALAIGTDAGMGSLEGHVRSLLVR